MENNYKKYRELIYFEGVLERLIKETEIEEIKVAIASAIFDIHSKEIELRLKFNED